jgi:hypothetical protein
LISVAVLISGECAVGKSLKFLAFIQVLTLKKRGKIVSKCALYVPLEAKLGKENKFLIFRAQLASQRKGSRGLDGKGEAGRFFAANKLDILAVRSFGAL